MGAVRRLEFGVERYASVQFGLIAYSQRAEFGAEHFNRFVGTCGDPTHGAQLSQTIESLIENCLRIRLFVTTIATKTKKEIPNGTLCGRIHRSGSEKEYKGLPQNGKGCRQAV